jgi:hypothetical protein
VNWLRLGRLHSNFLFWSLTGLLTRDTFRTPFCVHAPCLHSGISTHARIGDTVLDAQSKITRVLLFPQRKQSRKKNLFVYCILFHKDKSDGWLPQVIFLKTEKFNPFYSIKKFKSSSFFAFLIGLYAHLFQTRNVLLRNVDDILYSFIYSFIFPVAPSGA